MVTVGERIDWIRKNIPNPRTNKPIELQPFQLQFIEGTYADGVQTAGFSLPRKNGKTGLLAALALAELELNPDADVVLGATKVKQASRPSGIYGVMKTYIRLAGLDHMRVSRNNNDPTIKNMHTGGQAEAVSFANEDAAQGLNPSLCILDEFGTAFWTPARWGAAKLALGGRTDARVIGISTPSSQLSAMYDLRRQVEAGTLGNTFYWQEHSAPWDADIYDPATWALANPALGTFLSADTFPDDLADEYLFRMFRLGQWVDSPEESWLGSHAAQAWDALTDASYAFVEGAPTWVGLDYAHRHDTASVVICQIKPDGVRHYSARIWEPTALGNIDLREIGHYLRTLHETYDLVAIHYDPTGVQMLAEDLENEGLPMLVFNQSPTKMGPAVSNTKNAILSGEITHADEPHFRQQVLNAKPHYYDSTSTFTIKKRNAGKIDAAVALCMANQAALDVPHKQEYWIY